MTDELRRASTVGVDNLGRVIAGSSPANPLGATPADRLPSTSTLQYNGEGLPSLVTDPMGRQVEIKYSAVGASEPGGLHVATKRLADGVRQLVQLDTMGRVRYAWDSGIRTDVTYNRAGQVLSVTEAAGRPAARTTAYTYTADGNLLTIRYPNGGTVLFDYTKYDEQGSVISGPNGAVYEGRLTKIQHPDLTFEYFGYDEAGNLAWESRPSTDTTGTTTWYTTRYERDEQHRVKRIVYPDSPQGVAGFTVEYFYDEFGRVVRVDDGTGRTDYTFDALDRLTDVGPSAGRGALHTDYLRDFSQDPAPGPNGPMGTWITRTTLGGVSGTPGYWEEREDFKGRSLQTTNPFGQTFRWEYNPAGQPTKLTNANGTTTLYRYDNRGWLSNLQHRKQNGFLLDQFTYTYTTKGQLARELDARGRYRNFGYDALGQLTAEQERDVRASTLYQYDGNGNRKFVQRGNPGGRKEYYGLDPQGADRLLWTNGTNTPPVTNQASPYAIYSYDYRGQLTRVDRRGPDGVLQQCDLRWDTAGRLREIKNGPVVFFSAGYDGGGERLTKTDNTTGSHVYNFGLRDQAGTAAEDVIYTPGLAQRKGGATDRTFHGDWLGSTRYLTDSAGNTSTTSMRFNAFGERTNLTGLDGSRPTTRQFAGAHGYEREGADGLGLDYLSQRYYDSATGRFISRDPAGWRGGLDLYGYCENDPVNDTDPSGLGWQKRIFGGDVMGSQWELLSKTGDGLSWLVDRAGELLYHKVVKPTYAVKLRNDVATLQQANPETFPRLPGFGKRLDRSIDRVGEEAGKAVVGEAIGSIINRGGRFSDLDRDKLNGEVGHHMPQNRSLPGMGLTRGSGPALGMSERDHALTRTFSGRGRVSMREDARLRPRQRLARDVKDIRRLRSRFQDSNYRQGLRELLEYARTLVQFRRPPRPPHGVSVLRKGR